MITEFIYVRHGETEANRNAVLQGGGVDMPLNETGIRQAQAAAEYLSKEHFDVAFASELIRAAETAQIIAQGNESGFPLELVPQLREWNCGEWDFHQKIFTLCQTTLLDSGRVFSKRCTPALTFFV